MGPVFRLLNFPDELLLHISQYLSVRDILNCCLMCHRLREVLNDNEVWRRHVSPSAQAVSGLRDREQLLDPPLAPVLDNFCEQRTLYACKTRLMSNWRSGHCVECATSTTDNCRHHAWDENECLVYGDRFLFMKNISNEGSCTVNVWDVGNVPELYTTVPISNMKLYKFFIMGTKLVVYKCIKVVVYEIALAEREFPLLYSFLVTEDTVTIGREVDHPCDRSCGKWSHFSVDQYLVANKYSDEYECVIMDGAIDVWNIAEGTKVGLFLVPLPGYSFSFECRLDDKWLFASKNRFDDNYSLLQFDVKEKKSLEFVFSYTGRSSPIIAFDDAVIMFTEAGGPWHNRDKRMACIVYDLNTGMELKKRLFNRNYSYYGYNLKSTVVIDGQFVLLCKYSFLVVNALSLETIAEFPRGDLSLIVHQFKILNSIFVLAFNNKSQRLELWDIENRNKVYSTVNRLPKLSSFPRVGLNDLSSAFVYFGYVDGRKEICVAHFW